MKNTIKMVRLLSAAGFLIVSAFASAEVVVIVNSASPVNSASADDIAQIFLGKRNEALLRSWDPVAFERCRAATTLPELMDAHAPFAMRDHGGQQREVTNLLVGSSDLCCVVVERRHCQS